MVQRSERSNRSKISFSDTYFKCLLTNVINILRVWIFVLNVVGCLQMWFQVLFSFFLKLPFMLKFEILIITMGSMLTQGSCPRLFFGQAQAKRGWLARQGSTWDPLSNQSTVIGTASQTGSLQVLDCLRGLAYGSKRSRGRLCKPGGGLLTTGMALAPSVFVPTHVYS